MTATYLSYRLYSQDLSKSMARTATRSEVARDIAYYESNIGKVRSVDEFINDRRLFTFAMKANGLDDMAFAKAFMKKVLLSDLNDPNSFANKLSDVRFKAFAQAYNFTTSGAVTQNLTYAQNEAQEADAIELYSEQRVKRGVAAATEARYYESKMPALTSVDELIGNSRLFSFALTAYGIDPKIASATFIRNVLTSDLSDPGSVANTVGDVRYQKLAAAFSFNTDGSVEAGGAGQTATQLDDTIYLNYQLTGNATSPAAAAYETRHFESNMGTIANVDALLDNSRLYAYALTTFGINPSTASKSMIRQVLTSDLADPGSFANTQTDSRYRLLAGAFNFDADGGVTNPDGAQSQAQTDAMTHRYLITYDDAADLADASNASLYHSKISGITTVDQLIANKTLYAYALKAYGFDPSTEPPQNIRQALMSDLSTPTSFANRQTDRRYRDLAAAFNFGTDGKALQPKEAQVDKEELATIRLYNTRVGTSPSELAASREEGAYYHNTIIKVRSLDDFLSDKRLVTYVLKAFGFEDDERITSDALRKVLTSDPFDKNSYVNKQTTDPRFRALAAAYNFAANGSIGRAPNQSAQSRSDILKSADGYVRQTMETNAGTDNEGVRLALYFDRKASSITSPLDILADKALLKVVQTALGLPAAMSQAPIESQAAMIKKGLNVADLKDTAKREKFIARFTTMYDLQSGVFGASSPTSLLLGGGV